MQIIQLQFIYQIFIIERMRRVGLGSQSLILVCFFYVSDDKTSKRENHFIMALFELHVEVFMAFDSGESVKDVTLRARSVMKIMLYNPSCQITSCSYCYKNEIKQDILLSLSLSIFLPAIFPKRWKHIMIAMLSEVWLCSLPW